MNVPGYAAGVTTGLAVSIVANWFWSSFQALAQASLRRHVTGILSERVQTWHEEDGTKNYWPIEVKTRSCCIFRILPTRPRLELAAAVAFVKRDVERFVVRAYDLDIGPDKRESRFSIRDGTSVLVPIIYRCTSDMSLHPLGAREDRELDGDWDLGLLIEEDGDTIKRMVYSEYIKASNPNITAEVCPPT